jgi:hypothetical protein
MGFSSPHFAFFDSMSLQLVIPWRVALQQSPPPLHQPAALCNYGAAIRN